MASSFGRYQSGIEASTGNLVQASGQMAAQTVATGLNFGQNLAQGLQAYNENSAKNDILTAEAEALGGQIQQYAQMFGDSPEHKAFADSLSPFIEKLSKVPSMSLTQKMGTVTSVKAGFGQIGQQLQVFEMMRKDRMLRDMNVARGGVKEYDEVTVPTAIIPSGKMPYFHDKSYVENEAEITRLATEAKGRGANVDIAKVLNDWRADFKASAMSRTDMPPEVKEALIKQIDAGATVASRADLVAKANKEGRGLTEEEAKAFAGDIQLGDYAKTSTSVKEQLAPAKVNAENNQPVLNEKEELMQRKDSMMKAIEALKDNPSASNNVKFYEKQVRDADRRLSQISVAEGAKDELSKIDELIAKANESASNEDTTKTGWTKKLADAVESGLLDPVNIFGVKEQARIAIDQGFIDKVTPDYSKRLIKDMKGGVGALQVVGSILYPDIPSALGIKKSMRELTKEEERIIEGDFKEMRAKEGITKDIERNDQDALKKRLIERKEVLETQVATGRLAPSAYEIQDAQNKQAQLTQEAKPESSYTLTNQRNMSLGTTTTQVASSIESKRNDMKNFFTQKYGYIPASFEESFKAIYPEANFKTMETPYGVFMHDGKDWKQVQLQQPKVLSRKEMAEEKAVSFGKLQSDSSIDINEFGELVPNSGIYVRGIFSGSPTDASKFRTQMLEGSNAKKAVGRLIEINDMVGESLPWNAKLWGEAKALLPQIKAGLRIDIIGVGTVSNYEQQLIEEVVADPTKFWSLEASDRAKLSVIMDKISNKLIQEPANHGLEVKVAGRTNAQREKEIRIGAGKSKMQLDFEARGGKKGVSLDWNNANKLPDAFKKALTE